MHTCNFFSPTEIPSRFHFPKQHPPTNISKMQKEARARPQVDPCDVFTHAALDSSRVCILLHLTRKYYFALNNQRPRVCTFTSVQSWISTRTCAWFRERTLRAETRLQKKGHARPFVEYFSPQRLRIWKSTRIVATDTLYRRWLKLQTHAEFDRI